MQKIKIIVKQYKNDNLTERFIDRSDKIPEIYNSRIFRI